MLNNIALPGMKVVMNMDSYTRSYRGKDTPPNGTVGILAYRNRSVFFKERIGSHIGAYTPGVYAEDTSWNVIWEGQCKVHSISSTDVEIHPDDKNRYDERAETLWYGPVINDKIIGYATREKELDNSVRIQDLPETKFYEGDVVESQTERFHASNEGFEFVISRINYSFTQYMQEANDDRGQLYDGTWIDPKTGEYARRGSLIGVCDKHYNLVRRGNVWKHYHGETPEFRSLVEEATFYSSLGYRQEVRNPASGLYLWSLEEFKQAVKDGIVDCMTMGGLLLPHDRINAYRFINRDLGERLRQETVKGFSL